MITFSRTGFFQVSGFLHESEDDMIVTIDEPEIKFDGFPNGLQTKMIIPKGTQTDFLSTPPGTWNLFPKAGPGEIPGAFHDFLYSTQQINGVKITQSIADRLLLAALKSDGVLWIRREIMYEALRLLGWIQWGKYARRNLAHPEIVQAIISHPNDAPVHLAQAV